MLWEMGASPFPSVMNKNYITHSSYHFKHEPCILFHRNLWKCGYRIPIKIKSFLYQMLWSWAGLLSKMTVWRKDHCLDCKLQQLLLYFGWPTPFHLDAPCADILALKKADRYAKPMNDMHQHNIKLQEMLVALDSNTGINTERTVSNHLWQATKQSSMASASLYLSCPNSTTAPLTLFHQS